MWHLSNCRGQRSRCSCQNNCSCKNPHCWCISAHRHDFPPDIHCITLPTHVSLSLLSS